MNEKGAMETLIGEQIVASMKARNAERTGALRLIKTALINKAIEKRAALTQAESEQVLALMIKQRRDSIEHFTRGNRPELAWMFEAEARALQEIAASGTVRVPGVVALVRSTAGSALVLEHLELRPLDEVGRRRLGKRLAAMHRVTGPRYGWEMDNTIGSTLQPNAGREDWVAFFRDQRLSHQLDVAENNGRGAALLEEGLPEAEDTKRHVSTIADTWINLSYNVGGGERNRALTVIKARGTAHSNQVRELVLGSGGITLADVYTAGGDVLMGTARIERESEEQLEIMRRDAEYQVQREKLEAEVRAAEERIRTLSQALQSYRHQLDLLTSEHNALENARERRHGDERDGGATSQPPHCCSRPAHPGRACSGAGRLRLVGRPAARSAGVTLVVPVQSAQRLAEPRAQARGGHAAPAAPWRSPSRWRRAGCRRQCSPPSSRPPCKTSPLPARTARSTSSAWTGATCPK